MMPKIMKKKELKAQICSVDEGSSGYDSGILPGDFLLRVDGKTPRDVIDCYNLLSADGEHQILIERRGKAINLMLRTGEAPLGIQFETPVFDGVIKCNNRCIFCFVDQLPGGLSPELYVKDDDYRLSFLCGNFITLTNIRNRDLKRIIGMRLSPLYMSLHATDPALRAKIFGTKHSNNALKLLKRLLKEKIDVHIQIVLMKGLNDAAMLDKTLDDLKDEFEGVKSIGVVPVGISKCDKKRLLERFAFDSESSAEVIERIERRRKEFKTARLFASDEFFYISGESVPHADYYGDFPQLENGIGLARSFIDGWNQAVKTVRERTKNKEIKPEGLGIVTSPMGEWVLKEILLEKRSGLHLLPCKNNLFGERVNVCGLMPGKDVKEAACKGARDKGVSKVLVPSVALSKERFIDGVHLQEIRRELGIEVLEVECTPESLFRALREYM